MSDSLRDQLLGLGFKPAPKPEKPARPPQAPQRPAGARPQGQAPGRPGPGGGKPPPQRGAPPRGDAPHRGASHKGAQHKGAPQAQKPRTREEIDLAKAYAIRAQREKEERIEAERVKQEEARLRREAKAKLAEFVKDKGLNDAAAEIARHFPYGGKIKRIYVNAEQLKALNAGELGVVQLDGRYLLVTAAVLAEAEAIFAPAVALKVDPNATAGEDPYADPQYQVPDDLVW
ncbi:MAG: DUF2058 domain-containing protein [Lysobacteraceae bacterium]